MTLFDCGENAWARALIGGFPGPALVADTEGRVLHANGKARGVLTGGPGDAERLRDDLAAALPGLAATGRADHRSITLDDAPGAAPRSFLLALIPVPAPDASRTLVLLLAWETTLEGSLRSALAESRSFFRDLVASSSDFVWAVDAQGVITYASPAGILGLRGDALQGRRWSEVFTLVASPDHDSAAGEAVFAARAPSVQEELRLQAGEQEGWFRVSAQPVVAADGSWRGARGVASDITELKRRQAELARLHESERQLNLVLGEIRNEIDAEAMLSTAAAAAADAMELAGCWIFRRAAGQPFNTDTARVHEVRSNGGRSTDGDGPSNRLLKLCDEAAGASGSVTAAGDGLDYIAAPARHNGELLGVIALAREAGQAAPSRDIDNQFIANLADQVAAAIALGEKHDRLAHLSRTDSLTGLLNRGAFVNEAVARMHRHQQMSRKAALLFIDLDKFKSVNDGFGHGAGDAVLVTVANQISSTARGGDLAGRFGGDEFALWLDDADETVGTMKAGQLIDALAELKAANATAGAPPAAVDVSIGVAVYDPVADETVDELLARADAALYRVKAAGRSSFSLAPPASAHNEDGRPDDRRVGQSGASGG